MYFLLGPDIDTDSLETPVLIPAQHGREQLQGGWAGPGRVKNQEMPRAENMHVVIKGSKRLQPLCKSSVSQHNDAPISNPLALGVEQV